MSRPHQDAEPPGVGEYWNHNAAYHAWVCDAARERGGSVLDVGCGEGLLVERLAACSSRVVGIEPDRAAFDGARRRVARAGLASGRVELIHGEFLRHDFGEERFDVVVFVASLHHMNLAAALTKARGLLRPGGQLLVVGLARNDRPVDWLVSGLQVPVVWIGSRLHRERDPRVPIAEPVESLSQVKAAAQRIVPGARIRRALYFRYLLRWRAPGAEALWPRP